jgi:hypothetical protein
MQKCGVAMCEKWNRWMGYLSEVYSKVSDMKILKKLLIVTALASGLTSCCPVLYAPVGHNVPLFKQKGEALLNIGTCAIDDGTGFNLQGAVAVDSSVAIISSFYHMADDQEAGAEIKGKGNCFEMGIGKFWPVKNTGWVGDVFIGAAFTGIQNKVTGQSLDVNYVTPFVQPSFGYRNRAIELILSSKIGFVQYTDLKNELTEPGLRNSAETFYREKKSSFVIDGGITIRAGWKGIKLQGQLVVTSFNYNATDGNTFFNDSYGSLGLVFRISPKPLATR